MNYDELVKNHAGEMVEKLVRDIISKDAVDIRFEFEDNEQWAIVTLHFYEEDKEIALRLQADNAFFLHFGYYDDADEFFEIDKLLTDEEKMIIPKSLQKVLQKVLTDEQGIRVPGHLLSR